MPKEILKKTVHFFHHVRTREEKIRRRWLIALSSLATVLVFSLWILMFNLSFPSTASTNTAQISSLDIFKTGFRVTIAQLTNEVKKVAELWK